MENIITAESFTDKRLVKRGLQYSHLSLNNQEL